MKKGALNLFQMSNWEHANLFYMNSHKHVPAQQDVIKLLKAVKPGSLANYIIASVQGIRDNTTLAMKLLLFFFDKFYTF